MAKLLYIKANPKSIYESRTFRISEAFIKAYKESNPQDTIITLDLYEEKINFLSGEDLKSIFAPKTQESRNHPILKYAYQFAEADKYVIAEPMWNLSIPAILKAYIDYVSITGISFKYTENGAVGLLKGKKAVNISARGGDYSSPQAKEYEMGDRYLRTVFAFFGITDFTSIFADEVDVIGNDVEAILDKAIKEAEEIARNF